jgi:hypothetical protein
LLKPGTPCLVPKKPVLKSQNRNNTQGDKKGLTNLPRLLLGLKKKRNGVKEGSKVYIDF